MDHTAQLMNLATNCEVMTYLAQKILDTLAETQAEIEESLEIAAPHAQT